MEALEASMYGSTDNTGSFHGIGVILILNRTRNRTRVTSMEASSTCMQSERTQLKILYFYHSIHTKFSFSV